MNSHEFNMVKKVEIRVTLCPIDFVSSVNCAGRRSLYLSHHETMFRKYG